MVYTLLVLGNPYKQTCDNRLHVYNVGIGVVCLCQFVGVGLDDKSD